LKPHKKKEGGGGISSKTRTIRSSRVGTFTSKVVPLNAKEDGELVKYILKKKKS